MAEEPPVYVTSKNFLNPPDLCNVNSTLIELLSLFRHAFANIEHSGKLQKEVWTEKNMDHCQCFHRACLAEQEGCCKRGLQRRKERMPGL